MPDDMMNHPAHDHGIPWPIDSQGQTDQPTFEDSILPTGGEADDREWSDVPPHDMDSTPEQCPPDTKGEDDGDSDIASSFPEDFAEQAEAETTLVIPNAHIESPGLRPSQLPDGFMKRRGYIVYMDEKERIHSICQDFAVDAMAENADGSGGVEIVTRFVSISGALREVRLPRRLLGGDGTEYRAILLDQGFSLDNTQQGRKGLSALLAAVTSETWKVAHSRAGWTEEGDFILPGGVGIGPDGPFSTSEVGPRGHGVQAKGTLEDWKTDVAGLAVGNPVAMFAIACAFAGPLLQPMGMESGGFHLMGRSSQGKTATARLLLSVWGDPRQMMMTWNGTSNGVAAKAALRSGTALVLDELKEAPARIVATTVYTLTNGTGRARAGRSGEAREADHWTLMCVSTGEMTLSEHLAAGGEAFHTGQDVRLLSITVDGRQHGVFDTIPAGATSQGFVGHLEEVVQAHHGTAGPAFVQRLLAQGLDPQELKDATQACYDALRRVVGTEPSGTLGRVMRRFAAVMMAGELATELGVTGWGPGAVREAVISLFRTWRETSEPSVLSEAESAIARVRDVLLKGENTRFHMPSIAQTIHNPAGWKSEDGFYVLEEVWRKEMHPGLSSDRMARHLRAAGLLICRETGRLQSRVPSDLHPQRPRAFLISSAILGAYDEEANDAERTDEPPF
ncbi:DUF927 domain-containing protein [Paracoccus yeei]|uniref:DUF927 domain-containing protein n=1 Tax=Paracoccus yeei TaxID=147645 RepID=UPI0037D45366